MSGCLVRHSDRSWRPLPLMLRQILTQCDSDHVGTGVGLSVVADAGGAPRVSATSQCHSAAAGSAAPPYGFGVARVRASSWAVWQPQLRHAKEREPGRSCVTGRETAASAGPWAAYRPTRAELVRPPGWFPRLTQFKNPQIARRVLKRRSVIDGVLGCDRRRQPEPHPDPGWSLDCGVKPPLGVISTFWYTPPTGFDTTTKAGELLTAPAAQLGWQLFTFKVPLPDPVALPHDDHVMVVIDISPLVHPM